MEGAVVPIRCAHRDTVVYLLVLIDTTLGGCSVRVEAAVSETLHLDVVLDNVYCISYLLPVCASCCVCTKQQYALLDMVGDTVQLEGTNL